jgi:PrgI family protein
MQFEVPQFIEIEDKIFGPFTWRQFLYLGGGAGMAVVLFLTAPFIIFVLFGLPLGILAAALSFYPVNNRPFSYFVEAVYNYFRRHRLYLWQQKREIVHKQTFLPTTTIRNPGFTPVAGSPKKDITSLARRLELQALQKK